jgi:hypothetical protein
LWSTSILLLILYLLKVLWAAWEICRVRASTICAFRCIFCSFSAIFSCVWLVTFNTFGWLTAEIWRMPKILAVIALLNWSRVFVFLPPYDAMAELRKLKYFAHISTWGKRDHKDRVSG